MTHHCRPRIHRRDLLCAAMGAGLLPASAWAQAFPANPIRLVVGFVSGGFADTVARLVAPGLSQRLGVPVVVENKPGATGTLATEHVARATPNGYTLLMGTATPIIVAPQAMKKTSFNPLVDLVPINVVASQHLSIAANPKLNARSVKDLIELSRRRQVTIGVSGMGGSTHLLAEALIQESKGNFLVVPYKGTGAAVADSIAGHVDATVSDIDSFLALHRDGALRVVGIASDERIAALPDVPTVKEDVPGLTMSIWLGVYAPGKTPAGVVNTINAALAEVVKAEALKAREKNSTTSFAAMASSQAFQKFVAQEYARYGKLIRERGITIDG